MAPKETASVDLTLKPSEVVPALVAALKAGQPVSLWGPPGIGKSQVVKQVGAALGYRVLDVRAVLLDPVDLRGLPHVNGDGRTHWATPEFLPKQDDPPTIIFLDELTRAPSMVQNACFQLALDKRLGEWVMAPQHRIVTANNRETDGGGAGKMHAGLANRFVHIDVRADLDDWTKWAAGRDINPMLIGFLRFRPNLLHDFQPKEHAFPTPRSWEFVSGLLEQEVQPNIEFALVAGAVGRAAALEFTSFARMYRSLPDVDGTIANPAKASVPKDIATLYALAAALARRADLKNFANVLAYVGRDDFPKEFEVFVVKDALARDESLNVAPAFGTWFVKNQGLL